MFDQNENGYRIRFPLGRENLICPAKQDGGKGFIMNDPAASCRGSNLIRTVWVVWDRLWAYRGSWCTFLLYPSRPFHQLLQHTSRLSKTRHAKTPFSLLAYVDIFRVPWYFWTSEQSYPVLSSDGHHIAGVYGLCHNQWLPFRWHTSQ